MDRIDTFPLGKIEEAQLLNWLKNNKDRLGSLSANNNIFIVVRKQYSNYNLFINRTAEQLANMTSIEKLTANYFIYPSDGVFQPAKVNYFNISSSNGIIIAIDYYSAVLELDFDTLNDSTMEEPSNSITFDVDEVLEDVDLSTYITIPTNAESVLNGEYTKITFINTEE